MTLLRCSHMRRLVLAVAAALVSSATASAVTTASLWHGWKSEHGKSYGSSAEEASRLVIFTANLARFAERSMHDTARYGPDEWSDLTLAEFKAQQAGCFSDDDHDSMPASALPPLSADAEGKLPSVDWRDATKNSEKVVAVTPPKNQGAYGYCWAFGASGSLEGMNVVQQ